MPSSRKGSWSAADARQAVALGAVGLLVAACGGGTAPTVPVAAPTAAHPPRVTIDPAVIAANKSMATGVPVGDSAAPIETRFDVATVPRPGEPFTVRIAVMPGAPAPVLRLEVTGSDGLAILAPDVQVTREKVAAGSVVPLEVRAEATASGAAVLYVRAALDLPDGPQARTFAFPILVGPVAQPGPAKPPAAAKTAH